MLLQKYNQEMRMVWDLQEPPYHKSKEIIVTQLVKCHGLDEDTAEKAHQAACMDHYITNRLVIEHPYDADPHADAGPTFWIEPAVFEAEIELLARFNRMTFEEALENVVWFFDNLGYVLNVEVEPCQ